MRSRQRPFSRQHRRERHEGRLLYLPSCTDVCPGFPGGVGLCSAGSSLCAVLLLKRVKPYRVTLWFIDSSTHFCGERRAERGGIQIPRSDRVQDPRAPATVQYGRTRVVIPGVTLLRAKYCRAPQLYCSCPVHVSHRYSLRRARYGCRSRGKFDHCGRRDEVLPTGTHRALALTRSGRNLSIGGSGGSCGT